MKYVAIRICGPNKNMAIKQGLLKQIYVSPSHQALFRFCDAIRMPYAIMSRKYGICYPEAHTWDAYADSEMLEDEPLMKLLKTLVPKYENITFVYWNQNPVRHDKWVNMLKTAGFHVEEVRKLIQYQKYMNCRIF